MKSLSLRIFLSFWLALLGIVAAAIGVTILFLTHREDLPRARDAIVAEAAAALAQGDREALRRWAEGRDPGSGPRVFVFDQTRRELFGRPGERPPRGPGPPPGEERPRGSAKPALPGAPPPREEGSPPPQAREPAHEEPRFQGPHLLESEGGRMRPREPAATLIGRDGSVYRIVVLPPRPGPFGALGFTQVRIPILLIALAITALVSWLLARSITRPIDDLTIATQAFAAGRLDALPSQRTLARRDEVGRLAKSFGDMGTRIRELLASRERLLRDISHELRSPLARIRLALGLARQSGADVEQQLGRLERDSERLDALIGQVLSVTRLEAGSAALTRVDTDIVGLVAGITRDADFEAQAQGKSVTLCHDIDRCVLAVDPTWMASAIENVVRNAVRHTASASEVLVTLTAGPAALTVLVRDRGPGVPPAELGKIFEPFYRVTQARERDSGGEGLGLAITARVMAAHGGSVVARNAAGGGLEVELTLPRS